MERRVHRYRTRTQGTHSDCSRWMFGFFCFILLAPPVTYYGIDRQWTLLLFEAGVGLLFGWQLIEAVRGKRQFLKVPGMVPLSLFCLYILFQVVPLPPGLLKLLSPQTYSHYTQSIWLLDSDSWMPVSVYPKETWIQFFRYSSYILFYFVTVQILRTTQQIRKITFVLSLFGGIYAFLSLLQYFAPGQRVFWILSLWSEGNIGPGYGGYVNYSHYSGFMLMLFPLVLTSFMVLAPKVNYGRWQDRLIDFIGAPWSNHYFLSGACAILMVISILFSPSRGGKISLCLATLFFLGIYAYTQRRRSKSITLILLLALTLGLVGVVGWQPVFDRFDLTFDSHGDLSDQRLFFWQDSLPLIGDFPVFGTGFGSFVDSYPFYQTVNTGWKIAEHPHNDYLELLTDGGAIAAVLAICFLVTVIRRSWQAWRRRRNREARYLYLGGLYGLCAILLHFTTDFNLAIPPNGLFLFFLCGLLMAVAHNTSAPGSYGSDLKLASVVSYKVFGPIVAAIFIGGLFFNGGIIYSRYLAAELTQVDYRTASDHDLQALANKATSAITFDPFESLYRFEYTRVLTALQDSDQLTSAYTDLVRLRPLRGIYLLKAGENADSAGDADLAEQLMRAAVTLQPRVSYTAEKFALWLMGQDRIAEALEIFHQELQRQPDQTENILDLLSVYGPDDMIMADVLPEISMSWRIYGDYLAVEEKDVDAEMAYRHAILLNAGQVVPDTRPYHSFYRFLTKRKRYGEALAVMLDAVNLFPDDAGLHRNAGQLYERQGIVYRAVEEYRQALLLDPRQNWVRKRLAVLTGL